MTTDPTETVIPLLEEHLRISRRLRETGRVRVSVGTQSNTHLVDEILRDRLVEIERLPIGRTVTDAPPVREEGDTLVIPVLEEVLVVERRLVLREEVRVRLRVDERRHAEPVLLRRQDAAVERLPPTPAPLDHLPLNHQQKVLTMRTITGLFDSRPEAERTVEALVQQHGIDRGRVQVHAAGAENVTAGTTGQRSENNHGFLASLRSMFVPDDDRATYEEGLRRGGIMVAVQVSDEQLDGVMDVFEQHGAVDLDAREAEWRQTGWTGGSMAGAAAGTAGLETYGGDAVVGASSDGTRTGVAAMPAPDGTPVAATRTAATGAVATGQAGMAAGEEVIPLMEERLRVGKREVAGGRVRIRSYTVETPVQEQVTLREEHVGIERRTVDRPLTDADQAGFQDRVIEATETSEEAVIGKEARVREEIVVRKEAGERTQTVSDTVRRTEVEIDDQRTRTENRTAGTVPPTRNPER